MLMTIKSLLKKILGIFAMTDSKYTIKQIPDTSDEAGMVYCLTERATGISSNIFVYYKSRDISPEALKVEYVTYLIDYVNRTSRNQPRVSYEYIRESTGALTPVSNEHRESLFSYFKERRFRKLERSAERPADSTSISGSLSELNS